MESEIQTVTQTANSALSKANTTAGELTTVKQKAEETAGKVTVIESNINDLTGRVVTLETDKVKIKRFTYMEDRRLTGGYTTFRHIAIPGVKVGDSVNVQLYEDFALKHLLVLQGHVFQDGVVVTQAYSLASSPMNIGKKILVTVTSGSDAIEQDVVTEVRPG